MNIDEVFLQQQEFALRRRITAVERVIRSGRIDAGFKIRSVLPSQRIALTRLHNGQYGICVDCDNSIPRKRLESLPGAIRCTPCQKLHEHTTVAP